MVRNFMTKRLNNKHFSQHDMIFMSTYFFRLVKLGLDVNRRHELGWTALQVVVINRNTRYIVHNI